MNSQTPEGRKSLFKKNDYGFYKVAFDVEESDLETFCINTSKQDELKGFDKFKKALLKPRCALKEKNTDRVENLERKIKKSPVNDSVKVAKDKENQCLESQDRKSTGAKKKIIVGKKTTRKRQASEMDATNASHSRFDDVSVKNEKKLRSTRVEGKKVRSDASELERSKKNVKSEEEKLNEGDEEKSKAGEKYSKVKSPRGRKIKPVIEGQEESEEKFKETDEDGEKESKSSEKKKEKSFEQKGNKSPEQKEAKNPEKKDAKMLRKGKAKEQENCSQETTNEIRKIIKNVAANTMNKDLDNFGEINCDNETMIVEEEYPENSVDYNNAENSLKNKLNDIYLDEKLKMNPVVVLERLDASILKKYNVICKDIEKEVENSENPEPTSEDLNNIPSLGEEEEVGKNNKMTSYDIKKKTLRRKRKARLEKKMSKAVKKLSACTLRELKKLKLSPALKKHINLNSDSESGSASGKGTSAISSSEDSSDSSDSEAYYCSGCSCTSTCSCSCCSDSTSFYDSDRSRYFSCSSRNDSTSSSSSSCFPNNSDDSKEC